MRRQILTIVLALVVGTTVASVPVAAAEDPRFETYTPEPTVVPGQTTQVTVQFVNDAAEVDDRVKTARNVRATMTSGSTPFTIESGTHLLGTLADGRPVTDQFVLTVPEGIDPGTYRIPVTLTYEYDTDERERTTVYATVTVEDRASFSVESVESDIAPGEFGTVSVTVRNTGTETATDASIALTSKTGSVRFGSDASATTFVGTIAPNETATIAVDTGAPSSAGQRTYPVTARVTYENENGLERSSSPMTVGVALGPADGRFRFESVETALRVGEEGSVEMTIRNPGAAVRDVVVALQGTGMHVSPLETEYAIGTLGAGAAERVTFPIEVSDSAEPSPRQLSFVVRYETADGDDRSTSPESVLAPVAPERDQFAIDPVATTVTAGRTETVVLSVTNNGDRTVRNVNAKIFASDPLGAPDDSAFVESLAPGESTNLTFGVSVAGSAREKTYPLSMDFQYDVGGDSRLSKTYQVPVAASVPESSGFPTGIAIGAVAVVLALIGALWYWRR
ncbi:MAG: NEW3 domain-containing protein [Halanaeroarchaeum sp.]